MPPRTKPAVAYPDRPGPGWIKNLGTRPDCSERVRVLLMHGREPYDVTETRPDCKPGWEVATTRWTLTGSDFDVAWYLPI